MFFPARPSLVHGSVQSAECPSLSTILPPSMAIIVRPLPPQPYRQHPPPIRGDNRAVFLHQPLIVSMCLESSRPLTRIRPVSSGPYWVGSLTMPDFSLPAHDGILPAQPKSQVNPLHGKALAAFLRPLFQTNLPDIPPSALPSHRSPLRTSSINNSASEETLLFATLSSDEFNFSCIYFYIMA